MRKALSFFLLFLFLFSGFPFLFPVHAQNATCTVETTPSPVTTNDSFINIKIKTKGLTDGKKYNVRLGSIEIWDPKAPVKGFFDPHKTVDYTLTNGIIEVKDVREDGRIDPTRSLKAVVGGYETFQKGPYKVAVVERGTFTNTYFCETGFIVEDANKADCNITYTNTSFTSNDDISVKITGLDPGRQFTTYIQENESDQTALKNVCHTGAEYAQGVTLGKFENGKYFLSVFGDCNALTSLKTLTERIVFAPETKFCSSAFAIPGGGVGINIEGYTGPTIGPFVARGGTPPPSPCRMEGTEDKPTYICKTAVGEINTNPTEFVKRIMGIFLGLAGGIAVVLIIMAGYKILTSQGQPEKIQEARDTITSTIIGLLFMIFAIVILQIIGVDILKIPGFSK